MVKKEFEMANYSNSWTCYVEELLHTPGERVFGSFCTLFAMLFEVWPENNGQPRSARAF